MPRVDQKAGVSLKYLCLQNIAKFIDSVWCAHFLDHLFGHGHWLYVLGPFDHIPPSLAHDIFVHLKNKKLLRKHHIYLLLSPFAKKLDFSGCTTDLSLLLQLSSQRARGATHLDLSNTKIPKSILSASLPQLTLLTVLSVSHSNVDDEGVGVVGVYCSHLLHLDISYTSVSDRGFLTLFSPLDLSRKKNERFGKCQKIAKLSVAGSRITKEGALEALKKLSNLQVFDYENTIPLIKELCEEDPCISLKLKSLYSSPEELLHSAEDSNKTDDLAIAVRACPDANHVYINTPNLVTAEYPLSLLDLPHLKELHIKNGSLVHFPFLSFCCPVIERHGETLVSLHLAEIEEISVGLIRDSCPNLLHLVLLWNLSFVSYEFGKSRTPVVARNLFPKLLTAKLACKQTSEEDLFTQILFEDLVSLIRSPQLKELQLNGCDNLSDLAWVEAGESKLENLVVLELNACHNVTMEGLEEVIARKNCLEVLSLIKCEQLTRRDIQNYNKKVKRFKWKVQVNWS